MNIAWLTPEVPYPPIGGRNGVYNRIVQLSKKNNIYLFSIAYNVEEKNHTSEMEKYCKEVHFYNRSERKLITIIKSLFMPYSVASRYRKDLIGDIRSLINRQKIDVVIVDFPNMAKNIIAIKKANPSLLITMNEHNVEYMRMRKMKYARNISSAKRLAYFLESYRLEYYERKIYKSNIIKGITFFSEDDHKFFVKNVETGDTKLKTIPLGANNYNQEPILLNNKTLLFVGRLDHIAIPNVEAITWFVEEIWPKILKSIPDARFIIAGANPEESILNLQNENIRVISNFPSLKEVYGMADTVILPLLSGGGVKGKLLEAIAFRKHVITTEHGIEGTDFEHGIHVCLCSDADKFAQACIDALINPEKYKDQTEKAYHLFVEKYDWNSIGKEYDEFIKKMLDEELKI